jgi:hypothetical protein
LAKKDLSYLLIHLCILLISTVFTHPVSGQDSTIVSPFTKGKSLLLVTGNLSSTSVNQGAGFSGFKYITNDYLVGMSALKMIKNRFGVGGVFNTGRNESTELVKLETEVLYFGPWARFYWNNSPVGSLYPQISLLYVNYFSNREAENQGIIYEEALYSKGFGTTLGIGYSYIVNKHVNLEVGMIYNLFYLFGEIHNEYDNSVSKTNFMRTQIMFSVAFGVLFDKKVSQNEAHK